MNTHRRRARTREEGTFFRGDGGRATTSAAETRVATRVLGWPVSERTVWTTINVADRKKSGKRYAVADNKEVCPP